MFEDYIVTEIADAAAGGFISMEMEAEYFEDFHF